MFCLAHSIPNQNEAPIQLTATPCQFLFENQADQMGVAHKKADQVLEVFEECAISLLKQGQLIYFDALGGNNQCHLIALAIIDVYRRYLTNGLKLEKRQQTPEQKLLQLAFLSNSLFFKKKEATLKCLFSSKSLKSSAITLKELAQVLNAPKVQQACKSQLAVSIQAYIQAEIKQSIKSHDLINGQSALLEELCTLSQEDSLFSGHSEFSKTLYCYPKFSGVLLLLNQLHKNPIPLIFKVKVLCTKGGHHIHTYGCTPENPKLRAMAQLKLDEGSPALVFEGFSALDTGIKMKDYAKARAFCPHGLFSDKPKTKINFDDQREPIHEATGSCLVCSPCKEESCLSKKMLDQRLKKVGATGLDILRLAGADFTASLQKEYEKRFFSQPFPYPLLAELFQQAKESAIKLGFSSENPSAFLIEHAYSDTFKQLNKRLRLLDAPGIEHVHQSLSLSTQKEHDQQ